MRSTPRRSSFCRRRIRCSAKASAATATRCEGARHETFGSGRHGPLLLLALGGCSVLLPSQYTQISPHSTAQTAHTDSDIPLVSDYNELKRAILQFAEDGISHGVIRTTNYTGDVEADLSRAAYSVAREDPVGAYTIDFLTHDCSLIVSYYEITIDITFRDMAEDPRTLEYVTNQKEVETLLRGAMDEYRDHVTWYAVSSHIYTYESLDPPDLRGGAAALYGCAGAPRGELSRGGAQPHRRADAHVAGGCRIAQRMEKAVEESLQAASVYVRYRDTEWGKGRAALYVPDGAFHLHRAGDGHAALFRALRGSDHKPERRDCVEAALRPDRHRLPDRRRAATTARSMRGNIVTLDGLRYHVDLLRDLLADGSLHLRYDEEMIGYSWDAAQYPACPKPEPEIPAETQPEESTDDTSLEETTPDAPPADDAPDAETPAADAEQDEKLRAIWHTGLDFSEFSAIITPAFEMRV